MVIPKLYAGISQVVTNAVVFCAYTALPPKINNAIVRKALLKNLVVFAFIVMGFKIGIVLVIDDGIQSIRD